MARAMDRPNRPPPSSVRVRVTDRMDCPRLTRSPASSGSFLPSSLSHFSSSSVFSDDDDGRTFLAEWKMERPATTTEWSVSFILSAFSVFAARAPSQPLDYPSFLSASFHSLTWKGGKRNRTHHRTALLVNVSVVVAEAHLASLSRPRPRRRRGLPSPAV